MLRWQLSISLPNRVKTRSSPDQKSRFNYVSRVTYAWKSSNGRHAWARTESTQKILSLWQRQNIDFNKAMQINVDYMLNVARLKIVPARKIRLDLVIVFFFQRNDF